MTSQPGKQTIAIQILPNISRSKGNQAMKFGQLKECNMRNIFLERSCTKRVEKLFLDPFLKNRNYAYLWINSLKPQGLVTYQFLYTMRHNDANNIAALTPYYMRHFQVFDKIDSFLNYISNAHDSKKGRLHL